MEKLSHTTESILDENVEKLAALFPEVVTEVRELDGSLRHTIDVDALRERVGDVAEGQRERYQFTWPGKREAKREAYRQIDKCLRPCPEESVDWDTTGNLYIEGDNLDALKLLRNTYAGRVKMIYIDPPYNTGHDFIYDDDFAQTKADYDAESGDYDEEGGRLVANPESSGRFHSDWCSMMYPRLLLARDLLSEDGVIFISIGSDENANLQKIAGEVFGRENYIEEYVWESTFRPDNSSSLMRRNAEYVLCYARIKSSVGQLIGSKEKSSGLPSLTKNSMNPSVLSFDAGVVVTALSDGKYLAGDRGSYELMDDVIVENGRIVSPFRLRGRVIWGQKYLEEQIANGTEIIIKNDSFVPYTKKNTESIKAPTKILPKDRAGDVLAANAEMQQLFPKKPFDYPKPTSLLQLLTSFIDGSDFTVLDFFSGSATTAHAVMQLNAKDGGNRKFIMVQLPEVCDEKSEAAKAGYKNICEIGRERIRRAGKKIASEVEDSNRQFKLGEEPKKVPDVGFRTLKIDSSNFEDVSAEPEEYTQQAIVGFADNLKPDRTPDDLIIQVMLKKQIELSAPIEKLDVDGYTVFSVDGGRLVACFDRDVPVEVMTTMAKMEPDYAVMRDASFAGDDAVSNFAEIFKNYSSITEVEVI